MADDTASKLSDFTIYKDGVVWNASLVLLHHFRTKMADHWKGKHVLELGSGLGHLGWGLYQLGAHVTCSDTPLGDLLALRARVTTWLEEEQRTRDEGGQQSTTNRGSIRVVELTWGEEHWHSSPLSKERLDQYDVIILAEVFSIPEVHEQLLWTVERFSHDNVEIFSIFMNRPFSFMFFAHMADAGGFKVFQYDAADIDMCGMEADELGIFTHRVTYNPSSPRVLAKLKSEGTSTSNQ